MPISTETIVRVAHADVAMDMAFPRSIRHWHHQDDEHISWKTYPGDCDKILIEKKLSDNYRVLEIENTFPEDCDALLFEKMFPEDGTEIFIERMYPDDGDEILIEEPLSEDCSKHTDGEDDAVTIEGNCSNGVAAPHGGVIHIHGNLTSKIEVGGHHEIIITGDVDRNAVIDASGFCHVFVGGRFLGELRSSGSTKVWVESDFTGTIRVGYPSTNLRIGGDYTGEIIPLREAALLSLSVKGFAAHASLMSIADCNYTVFEGSIGRSDVAPGLYPTKESRKEKSSDRWCVKNDSRT